MRLNIGDTVETTYLAVTRNLFSPIRRGMRGEIVDVSPSKYSLAGLGKFSVPLLSRQKRYWVLLQDFPDGDPVGFWYDEIKMVTQA